MDSDYRAFLDRKRQLGGFYGFEPIYHNPALFPFQVELVSWALRKGRAAIFADCGLGKTPIQLVWAENVVRKTNGRVLILTPLAVSHQTVREGEKFGIEVHRADQGKPAGKISVTNYERLHLFDPNDFVGVVCDESSILKHFSGATQKAVTRFMAKKQYRLLCTATAAPNDYIELGTSSEALGELGYSDMLTRFFKQTDNAKWRQDEVRLTSVNCGEDHNYYQKLAYRVAQQIGQWKLKAHAEIPFWKWIASWARACRRPEDLGFSSNGFRLPPLIENTHVIKAARPPDGMLFTMPAFGLAEERDERKRTLKERCEMVAQLVSHDQPAIAWCHFNVEGDLIPFRSPSITSAPDATARDSTADTSGFSVRISPSEGPKSDSAVSTRDLYPLRAELNPQLSTALQLLDEGIEHLNSAVAMFAEDDVLSSDDALQRFQALLPELFCCRDLGDGFGAIVSAIYHVLKNLEGNPLNPNQLQAIRNIVRRLSTEPFIGFDEATDEIMSLDDAGLRVEPSHFRFLADLLSE